MPGWTNRVDIELQWGEDQVSLWSANCRKNIVRRLRFNLRWVLAGTALFAIWLTCAILPKIRQGSTVAFLDGKMYVSMDRPTGFAEFLLLRLERNFPQTYKRGVAQYDDFLGKPRYIYYRGCQLDDQVLERISTLQSITSITYDDIDFDLLGYWPVDKNYHPITDVGIRHLKRLPLLVGLTLRSELISNDGMMILGTFPSLSNLFLESPHIDDWGLNSISSLQLTHLNLFAPKITDQGMRSLAKIQTLNTLDLRLPMVTDQGVAELARLPSLQHLAIECQMDGTCFQALSQLEDLYELRILKYMSREELHSLTCLTNVTMLSVECPYRQFGDYGGLRLEGEWDFGLAEITDADLIALAPLARSRQIRGLRVHSPLVTADGLSSLLKIESLSLLDVGGCSFRDEDIESFLPVFCQLDEVFGLELTRCSNEYIDNLKLLFPSLSIQPSDQKEWGRR
jgi:hypothetical protein